MLREWKLPHRGTGAAVFLQKSSPRQENSYLVRGVFLDYPKNVEKVVKRNSTHHNCSMVYVCQLEERIEEEKKC